MSEEEVKDEMGRANKALKSAEILYKEKLYEDSISRSYYAVLHAAKAALLSRGIEVDSHEAVKRLFGLHIIKTGISEKYYGLILREEQDDRMMADYNVGFSPEEERVFQRLEDARDFVSKMESIIG
ncbi:MAG TPA: HEPN domain-containing protein [Leptospiraceae bacterium]|nr:HEPN domain-containing protein [Leptospiraceae bacterium]HNF14633.1 HEPN domain-containing protein [Leptospiraceae bacterium]HNH07364.1 HEPN domain-containing protein [Leptospiraceae bacterium]HNN04895.1 HEPN domain-containing protein [Leptospiraceae bacterium]HNO25445.1 HEPN domain-containing protein [Leptospiraceae bacterium]